MIGTLNGKVKNHINLKIPAKLLAELGYVTFTFDFCGGGLGSRSDGKSEDMTLLTEKADLLTVIDYVKKCPYVDSAHISLLGCSQGGFVSALAAKELQEGIENGGHVFRGKQDEAACGILKEFMSREIS